MLFVPPDQTEVEKTEAASLLKEESPSKPPQTVALQIPQITKELVDSDSEEFEDGRRSPSCEFDLGHSDVSSLSEDEHDDEEDGDDERLKRREHPYNYDDTICSNRSEYFKMYYMQRGLNGNKGEETRSHVSNISTYNSLTSLFKEKMKSKKEIPAPAKSKASFGLYTLVTFLFVVIVVGISLINYYYYKHLMDVSIFGRIVFAEDDRHLDIYDQDFEVVTIAAQLGVALPPFVLPSDCTHYMEYLEAESRRKKTKKQISIRTQRRSNASLQEASEARTSKEKSMSCFDWAYQARLLIRDLHFEGRIQCFNFFWKSSRTGTTLTDCVSIGDVQTGMWWGGAELVGIGLPLDSVNEIPPTLYSTNILGPTHWTGFNGTQYGPWGGIQNRVWVSHIGGLLIVPDSLPLKMSINSEKDRYLCMTSSSELFPDNVAILNYTICSGPDTTSIIDFLYAPELSLLKGVPHSQSYVISKNKSFDAINKERVTYRIKNPVWHPWLSPEKPILTAEVVLKYVHEIVNSTKDSHGYILLPSSWQIHAGMFDFDKSRFPDPKDLAANIEKLGFRIALSLNSLIAADTTIFEEGTINELWIRQTGSNMPALTYTKDNFASAMIDFTKNKSRIWLKEKLSELVLKYKIDKFHLQPLPSVLLPKYHEFSKSLPNSDMALRLFYETVAEVAPPISTEVTIEPPPLPTFVTLGNDEDPWSLLQSLIPRTLSLSMTGFPLVDIGIVGGSCDSRGYIPERELYIRWLQVATFMPAYQMCVIPKVYDKEVEAHARKYEEWRENLVLPRFLDSIEETLSLGRPLIKPLHLVFNNINSTQIGDQWMLGDDIMIAPVVTKGMRSRNIYLPPGIWRDLSYTRTLRKGGRWLIGYQASLYVVPHFELAKVDDSYK